MSTITILRRKSWFIEPTTIVTGSASIVHSSHRRFVANQIIDRESTSRRQKPQLYLHRRRSLPCTFHAQQQFGYGPYSRSLSGSSTFSASTPDVPKQTYVVSTCQQLYNGIMDFNDGIRGPLLPYTNQSIKLPMVLCVGNHSSGKSSFINYVLGRNVQTAGVAPTDDCFTIIAPNNAVDSDRRDDTNSNNIDYDQDGFAIIGNPDYGFTSLRQFGPTLQHHTVFKLRSNIDSNFIIVDSPGMIDAPANYSSSRLPIISNDMNQNYDIKDGNSNRSTMDRGYDFTGVVKWYADRADVVLLFFDPDKPGTTGETLSILINALSNIDHKLFIIFNKADRFMNQQIHDFARAYGSLCWNLSKVIPRKDLPRIYTMCLPVTSTSSLSPMNSPTTLNEKSAADQIPPGLQDLYDAREEVVSQVRKAPERRLDNVITNLYDSISLLHMYARIVQDVQQRYYRNYWSSKYQELLLLSSGMVCTIGCAMYGVPVIGLPTYSTVLLGSITVLSTAGNYWYNSYNLQIWEYHNCTSKELYNAFTRLYAHDIMNGNESVAHTWTQIRDQLSITLQPTFASKSSHTGLVNLRSGMSGSDSGTIRKLPIINDKDLQKLHNMLIDDIPRLRRHVSPAPTTSNAPG